MSQQIDQASELREWMQERQRREIPSRQAVPVEADQAANSGSRGNSLTGAQTLAITSGKGGVGKSVMALNLAIALAQAGERVCLLDANPGVSTQDLLCGLNGYWNLSHVLTQSRQLSEVMLAGPAGITIIPGAASLVEQTEQIESGRPQFDTQLARLEREFDFLVFDCGTGVSQTGRQLAAAADRVLLLTNLELTSLAETYIAYKGLHSAGTSQVQLLFNQATSGQAQAAIQNMRRTVRHYLQAELEVLGCLPADPLLAHSIGLRKPFQVEHARTLTGQMFTHLARLIQAQHGGQSVRSATSFLQRLQRHHRSAA